jgi:GNAT superfamily N-acetyltransferase
VYNRGDLTFKILNGKDESTLYVGDDKEVKAYYVYYFEDVGDKEVPFLNLEIVKPSARGQGITTQVIDFILKRHGAIGSDYELTGKEGKGSYNSFEKLGNIYRCGVYSDDGTFTPTKDLSRKYMTSIAARFVVFNKKK